MSASLVSICVPTYNRCRFLRETVPTILAQDYAPLEIVISDNASTDDTEAYCRDVANADPRVRYIRQPTGLRIYRNHNVALEAAKGEFVAFFHDDDLYAPQIVSRYVALLNAHPSVGVVCADWGLIAETGRDVGARVYDVPEVQPGRAYVEQTLRSGRSSIALSAAMIRRSALDELRLGEEGPIGFEDFVLWFRLAERCDVGHIGERLWRYRVHRAALSRITITRMARDYRENLVRYCDDYLRRHPGDAATVTAWKAAIDRYLFWALGYEAALHFRHSGGKTGGRVVAGTTFELTDYRLSAEEFAEVLRALERHRTGLVQHAAFACLMLVLRLRLTAPLGWVTRYPAFLRRLVGME